MKQLFSLQDHQLKIKFHFSKVYLLILSLIIYSQASFLGPDYGKTSGKISPKVKIVKIIDGGTINHVHHHHHHKPMPEALKIVKVQGGGAPPPKPPPTWQNNDYGSGPSTPVQVVKIIDGGIHGGEAGNNGYESNEPNVQVIKIIKQAQMGGSGWYNANNNGWN